jgi:DNA-3-methyladenine glycosylase I
MKKAERERCPWPLGNEQMVRYHDVEWGVPVHDDAKHFEYLILDAFQAGLSWAIVMKKREGFRRAFAGFNPARVARFTDARLEKLLEDDAIVRNRLKVFAARENARAFLAVQREFGSFDRYIWQFTGGKPRVNRRRSLRQLPAHTAQSDAMSVDLKKRGFRFVGSTICYAYMQAAGMVNDHLVSCFRHAQLAKRA